MRRDSSVADGRLRTRSQLNRINKRDIFIYTYCIVVLYCCYVTKMSPGDKVFVWHSTGMLFLVAVRLTSHTYCTVLYHLLYSRISYHLSQTREEKQTLSVLRIRSWRRMRFVNRMMPRLFYGSYRIWIPNREPIFRKRFARALLSGLWSHKSLCFLLAKMFHHFSAL